MNYSGNIVFSSHKSAGFENKRLKLSPIEQWVSDESLMDIYTSAYWNDIDEEKSKEFWISDGDFSQCGSYLSDSGLLREYAFVEEYISKKMGTELKAVDIAAGMGWASALLSRVSTIDEVYAVEISRHRIDELFPYAVDMFGGIPEKIKRVIGSFYNLKLNDNSIDIAFMSQAFHHAERPLALLFEVDRVLSEQGIIVLIGEHYLPILKQLKGLLGILVKEKRLETNFYKIFPPDKNLGDHYYRLSDYYLFFQLLGYKLNHKKIGTSLVFIASKN